MIFWTGWKSERLSRAALCNMPPRRDAEKVAGSERIDEQMEPASRSFQKRDAGAQHAVFPADVLNRSRGRQKLSQNEYGRRKEFPQWLKPIFLRA